jgi:hypothetical protein
VTKSTAHAALREAKLAKLKATAVQRECNEALCYTNVVKVAVSLICWQAKGAPRYTNGALLDTNVA